MLTTTQFQTLDDLYAFYNAKLFGSSLPECIVNLSRRARTYGFFVPNLWASHDPEASEPEEHVHEISLNPDHMMRPSIQWHSTFVHEMVHLWQHECGKPSRLAYHNKEWACKMMDVGLLPTDNGQPDGKMTGQNVGHLIISGGLFETVFNSLDPDDLESLRLKYLPVASLSASGKNKPDGDDGEGGDDSGDGSDTSKTKSKSGTRIKYTCDCGNNIWARSDLNILCLDCDSRYVETSD